MASLAERVQAQSWYHTLELQPDLVTRGFFDLRPFVARYGLPERLDGLRCLDVGTWDGFWAFELERRGAAEVIALDLASDRDLDWPPRRRPARYDEGRGAGFRLAAEVLGSQVQRVEGNVYDADPAELGTFDLVLCGSVLLHLRDQLLALERIAALCRGTFISAEEHDRLTGLLPFPASRYRADRERAVVFWLPAARTWRRMLWTAGFDEVREHGRFVLRGPDGLRVPHVVHHAGGSVTGVL
ncbi:MAG TPA: class I SAM-dependent methyltransferase [Solirubrobacteraceae bacterium]|jgi:tRNA (mo5U34)-methyltransferase|nr:class I SAM-dependent methyltransferase [Solirubrobacteraceae bacterium]